MKLGLSHYLPWCAFLFLASCARGGGVDPAITLEHASSTAQQVRSALFDATFSYTNDTLSTSGMLDGSMAEGGRQIAFSIDAEITRKEEGLDKTVMIGGRVIVPDKGEAFVLLQRADGSVLALPGIGLAPQEMLGRWFSMRSNTSTGSVELTPDPSFIALQTQSLVVTNDRSYEDVDGHRCFVYDVHIDRAKMLGFLEKVSAERGQSFDRAGTEAFLNAYDAQGTVWIDAESFLIRRITWRFDGIKTSHTASFTLHLNRHNEPVTITPPTESIPLFDALSMQPLPSL